MGRESTQCSIVALFTRFSHVSYASDASPNVNPTASRSMAVTAMHAMSSVNGRPPSTCLGPIFTDLTPSGIEPSGRSAVLKNSPGILTPTVPSCRVTAFPVSSVPFS